MDPFRSYDVRGLYPQELDEVLFEKIGRAFVLLYKLTKVYVGRDCRRSSESLSKAFIAGALAQGADVVDMGLCSTPVAYFATQHGAAAMITASHLGKEFNGVKMVLKDLAHVDDIPGIKALTQSSQWPDASPGTISEGSFVREYVTALNKEGIP
ncbi:MAG: phosphomannomutase/phosphoglucomutase, partial [Candidatus Woesearchaeota archaeon]|nr:phosphomannomutase/phosphoglucomutase [Candidatus Woesearchaeota archaeon]